MKSYLIIVFGILLPCTCLADELFTSQNQSFVSADKRVMDPVSASLLTVGPLIASFWSAIQKDTTLKLQIRNDFSDTTELQTPSWYLLHGFISRLPPPVIKNGLDEMQFDKTPGGNQGTEGLLAYNIFTNGKLSGILLIKWRVPQFGIYEDISFAVSVEKPDNKNELNEANLKSWFNNMALEKASQHHSYFIKDSQLGHQVSIAMGTQSVLTLKVAIKNKA